MVSIYPKMHKEHNEERVGSEQRTVLLGIFQSTRIS